MFQFTKEARQKIDSLLENATLSKAERGVIIAQLEYILVQEIAKLLARDATK